MTYKTIPLKGLRIIKPIIIMDICTVNYIKEVKRTSNMGDKRKKERLDQLASLVFSNKYKFSFLLAIIEKSTDHKHPLTAKEMIDRFQADFRKIMIKCGVDNIVESYAGLKNIIKNLMDETYENRERAELSLDNSLNLLKFYATFGINQTPKASERLVLARKIAAYGEEIGLARGYPTIAICIASIYGCIDARRILKISGNESLFNPNNALGDIMSLYRMAKARHRIKREIPTARIIFRTEDEALERMHEYYIAEVIDDDGEIVMLKIFDLQPEKLFPVLYRSGIFIDEKELFELFKLLNFKV